MRKVFSILIISLLLVLPCFLTGCVTQTQPTNVNNLTVEACMKDAGVQKSLQGERLTYYYKGGDELSLYYVTNWRSGIVSMRKYFTNKEKYELQKEMYNETKSDDNKMEIYINNYNVVEDMDSFWTEIENSSVYTIVK